QMCSEFQGPCPAPAASGSSQPCVVSCGASRVIIFPPPVLVTFPGPILSTCPQETVLGFSGMPEGSPEMALGSSGTTLSSHGAQIPRSGAF
ncbi:KRFT protein, partial [Prunella fulvescens]|nr:KRFT protein [Prunella fulvescens]